ncbi:MAG TPA: antitoxin family protein [Pyrinomonadaceae bacterium]|nr:antitoxin family protein [Pyrinomonadaceae bacterium]
MTTITAVYENGVLRPTAPLDLPENSRVQIQVREILSEEISAARRRLHSILVASGLSLPARKPTGSSRLLTLEQRERLARKAAVGRSLSDLIIEERAGR